MPFPTPQDAEDAFYDAIEANDLAAMAQVWEESAESACLLPMQPLFLGYPAIMENWQGLLHPDLQIEISIQHLRWIESGSLAIHLIEERIQSGPQQLPQPPIYATNIFRNNGDGWQLLLHTNAPAAPPAAFPQ